MMYFLPINQGTGCCAGLFVIDKTFHGKPDAFEGKTIFVPEAKVYPPRSV
jgi:hypothetical protein